uniref:Trafficking protein particle complex subunit n=1 Tax=Angiostrongylus cantonensis TaxID=6313 RepID=A0A0K0DJJ3_ANGCA
MLWKRNYRHICRSSSGGPIFFSHFRNGFMTIFNFYLFNRDGACIFYKEWRREKQSGMPKREEFKLMFGMLLSLRSFAERLSSKDGNQLVRYFKTSKYKMNYMEIPTGLKMVMNTDPSAVGIPELLRAVYQVIVISYYVPPNIYNRSFHISAMMLRYLQNPDRRCMPASLEIGAHQISPVDRLLPRALLDRKLAEREAKRRTRMVWW